MRPRVQPPRPEKAEPRPPSRVPDSRTEQGGSPGALSPAHVAQLQRTAGNAAVLRAVEEARHTHGAGCGHASPAQSSPVQRSSVPEVLRAPGRPLDAPVRAEMEARLGADFSDVRLHTGPTARRSAAEIGARAYTSGSHVVLGAGGGDRHTLAHELTHVIQQRSGPVAGTDDGTGLRVSDPSDRFERAAEAGATRALAGPVPGPVHEGAVSRGHGDVAAVQRVSLGEVAEKVADLAPAGDANNQFTGASVAGGYKDPNAATNAAQYGGVVGSAFGVATSSAGVLAQAANVVRARKGMRGATPGTAAHHAYDREVKAGGAGTAEQGLGFVSTSTGLAAAVMNLRGVAQEVAGGVGAASSGAGLLAGLVQSVRFIRKADKARRRLDALRTLMADENAPGQALEAANREVAELERAVLEGRADVEQWHRDFQSELRKQAEGRLNGADVDHSRLVQMLGLEPRIKEIEAELLGNEAELAAARLRQQERQDVSEKMESALRTQTEKVRRYNEGAPADVSLREIQEYAAGKNSRGVTVKAIGAVAALLGVGGSVAALVAGAALAAGVAAGAGVLVATPVGWALAGAAATVALGVAGWKTWRFFQHRWEQSAAQGGAQGPAPTLGARLRDTLAFWKKSGPNERNQYAAALYEMARDETQAERAGEARRTLVALGLDWAELNGDPEHGTKLIAAKFASTA
ncbi:DUF4157 domain-containing protein [Streptomyces sp. NPDC101175]|uniref:eCIS core domain-containing protein n=1 Tax=Streptomyces sp. NPDC101175 TaxID=3366123 RepID=UPI003835A1C3